MVVVTEEGQMYIPQRGPDVSFHVTTAFPPQQGGPPGGPQLRGLHHPNHGANPSIPPPHQQQPPPPSQSQHSGGPQGPAPTSTPPGPSEMGKQGPPHLQGQPQMQQGGQMQLFNTPNQQRPNQSQPYFAGPRGPTPRMQNHRQVVNMQTNNVGQQIFSSHVPVQQMPMFSGHVVPSPLNPNQMFIAPGQMPMFSTQPRHQNTGTSYYPQASQQQIMMQQHQMFGGFQSGPQGHQYFFQSMRGAGVGGATGVGGPGLGSGASQQVVVPGAPPQMGQGGQVPMMPLASGNVMVPGITGDSGGPAGPIGGGGGGSSSKLARRKYALDIVDPCTMKNVDIYESSGGNTPPRSGDSSARETPQPMAGPGPMDVAADFAARVAKAASEKSSAPQAAQPSYSEPPNSVVPPQVLNLNGPDHIGMNSIVTSSEVILSQTDSSISKSQILVLEESSASPPPWKPQTQPKVANIGIKSSSTIIKGNKIDISMNKMEDQGHVKVESESSNLAKLTPERERLLPPGVPSVSARDMPPQQVVVDIPAVTQIVKEHQPIIPVMEPVVSQDVTPVVSALTNSPDIELHRNLPRDQYPSRSSSLSNAGGVTTHPSPRRKRVGEATVEKVNVPQNVSLVPNISVVSSQAPPSPLVEIKQRDHSVAPITVQVVPEQKRQVVPEQKPQKISEIPVEEQPPYVSSTLKEKRDQDKPSRAREKSSQGRETERQSRETREKSQGQEREKREKSSQGRNKESPVPFVAPSSVVPITASYPDVVQSVPKPVSKPSLPVMPPPIVPSEDNKHQPNGDARDIPDGKSTQKSKHKRVNKMLDLNRKGAEKEGTDMDAFSEPPLEETPVAPSPPPAATIMVGDNQVVKNEESEADKEEEKLVAARNEENTKVSAAALEEDNPVIENTPIKTALITLKHNYKEDQWSPLNPEGKKKYEREFLMGLRNEPHSKKKPDNLPDIDVVFKDNNKPRAMEVNRGMQDTFMPNFVKGGPSRGGPMVTKRGSQQGKVKGKSVIHVNLSLKDDVKLRESDNAWRPGRKKPVTSSAASTEQDAENEDLYKKVRGVLNKLTPQKFKTLVDQVQSLPIDNSDKLQGVIRLVFEKAVDEPSFSVAYAQLCKVLSDMQVPAERKTKDDPQFVNFRKLLVNRCQHEFEKNNELELNRVEKRKEIENTADPEKKKELQLIYEEEERKVRMKSVGNIRFIGELFKLQMLTTNIMHRCIKQLLGDGDEESLECLCKLLSTIGKDLESKKQDLNGYFTTMKDIANKRGAVSSRVRFMLQDIIELRSGKWVPRRDDSNPKTIDQIQRDADKESLESQMMLNTAPPTPRRQDDRGGGNDRRKRGGNSAGEDGWAIAGRAKAYTVDTTRLKQHKIESVDNFSLGNRSMFTNWNSSQTKTVDSGKKTSTVVHSGNYFAALASNDTPSDDKKSAPYPSSTRSGLGKSTPSPSMEKERMLASFRPANDELRSSRSNSVRQSSRSSSRDNSSRGTEDTHSMSSQSLSVAASGDDVHKNPASSFEPVVSLTKDQITSKTALLLDEFLNNSNLEETSQSIAETFGSADITDFLIESLNHVLEKSSHARQRVGVLFCHLIKANVITKLKYFEGLTEIFEVGEDLAIDVPKVWLYLAEIIAPSLTSETLTFSDFREVSRGVSKLVIEILQLLVKEKGPTWIYEKWTAAEIKWTDVVDVEDVDSFVKENKLEYTLGAVSSGQSPSSTLTMDEVQHKLVQFLKPESGSSHSFDEICDWIGANVGVKVTEPQFIRALMTALCESSVSRSPSSAKLIDGVLEKHTKYFQKYIDNKDDLELQCLFAVQAFNHRLEHPQGLLCSIFHCLWENNLISNESFTTWESNTDLSEQPGKGVALKSLTSFFTSLREAEEESEES